MRKFQEIAVVVALLDGQRAVIMHIRPLEKRFVGAQIRVPIIDVLISGKQSLHAGNHRDNRPGIHRHFPDGDTSRDRFCRNADIGDSCKQLRRKR